MKSLLTSHKWPLVTALALTAFYNLTFFQHVLSVYPLSDNFVFVASLVVLLFCATALMLVLLCIKGSTRWVLGFIFVAAAFAAYYMDTFNVVIDQTMLLNVLQTDVKEASDLFTGKLVGYLLILGVLPVYLISQVSLVSISWRKLLSHKALLVGALIAIAAMVVMPLSNQYSSFFREHKVIRFYANPLTPLYAAGQFAFKSSDTTPIDVAAVGTDAHIPTTDVHRELIVIVVGETARSDRFSLNGYAKPTNPLLSKEKVVSFKNFTSCGTSTAVSVPCMFSPFGREDYSEKKFHASENLIDVLAHANVNVLWRDNNSSSKGVAVRAENVLYEDYQTPTKNTICDIECRDEGMLVGLQNYIDQHPTGDITVVLHQMGSHGPAYYKRYPAAFEQFKPTCQNNLLEQCSVEEISNTYDNTILYTDYFLSKIIGLLKNNTPKFESAMFYLSDHGESLGENGIYLHGMPYAIAPKAQTHVGAIMWISDNFDEVTFDQLNAKSDQPLSQDNLFHTALGFMEIESKVYRPELDILKPNR